MAADSNAEQMQEEDQRDEHGDCDEDVAAGRHAPAAQDAEALTRTADAGDGTNESLRRSLRSIPSLSGCHLAQMSAVSSASICELGVNRLRLSDSRKMPVCRRALPTFAPAGASAWHKHSSAIAP